MGERRVQRAAAAAAKILTEKENSAMAFESLLKTNLFKKGESLTWTFKLSTCYKTLNERKCIVICEIISI